MTTVRARRDITAAEAGLVVENPLAAVNSLSGVLVHDVGQGDAISLLNEEGRCVLRVDYGGLQSAPFQTKAGDAKLSAIDAALPVETGSWLMLTHWDEDHWCSAKVGSDAVERGHWLTPRQWTSPRAVDRSARINNIWCVPEAWVGAVIKYEARDGSALWWEKLDRFDPKARSEDCNHTGVALSVTSADGRVIFLPGDAPFHRVPHYRLHADDRLQMRGLVAFHHGSGTHWTKATEAFLGRWADPAIDQTVVFSCGDPNTHGHPDQPRYGGYFASSQFARTPAVRNATVPAIRIKF